MKRLTLSPDGRWIVMTEWAATGCGRSTTCSRCSNENGHRASVRTHRGSPGRMTSTRSGRLHARAGSESLDAGESRTGAAALFDKRLSRDGTVVCATCHDPKRAFSDGRTMARGVGGANGTRNSPAIANRGYGSLFFWDGCAKRSNSRCSSRSLTRAYATGTRAPDRTRSRPGEVGAGEPRPHHPLRRLTLRTLQSWAKIGERRSNRFRRSV